MTSTWVNADHSLVPDGWQFDPIYREQVYDRIRALMREGFSHMEIARKVGVSSRTVNRLAERGKEPVSLCGAWNSSPRKRGHRCRHRVIGHSGRCYAHR